MIFSRWNPNAGAYDYFESPGGPGLNDDLPTPALPPPTKLGVPSTACGRPVPRGAAYVGAGELPQGVLTTPSRPEGLGEVGLSPFASPWVLASAAAAAASLVTWLVMRRRR